MPGLTIKTDSRGASATARGTAANPRRASTSSRASSPPRPPISPITPTLAPAQLLGAGSAGSDATTARNAPDDFSLGRPIFTHTSQTDQVGIAPPPAQPIDFDSNPDVLALKSAISILQLQRARATADIQSLSRAKEAALADPEAFAADLAAGRVRMEGDPLFSGTRANGDHFSFGSSSSSDDDEEEAEEHDTEAFSSATTKSNGKGPASPPPPNAARKQTHKSKRKGKQKHKQNPPPAATPPWQTLPKPQNIVRCPPINWAQYGVVGESLDKLHAEQLAAPTPGAPAVLGPGGIYEPQAASTASAAVAGTSAGDQAGGARLVGVAAPYNPLRDKLVEKKGKGGRR